MVTVRDGHPQALASAAEAAGAAPSIHNTQPWHWRVHDGVADLFADPRRQLLASDPDRRLLILSCGMALHHARIALAAEGVAVEVDRIPDPGNGDLLATVSITGSIPVTPSAMRLVQTAEIRHTDRRPLLDEPVPPTTLAALHSTMATSPVRLDVLSRDQVIELAAATDRSQSSEIHDDEVRAELQAWTTGEHPDGTGIPDANIPQRPLQTTVPSRDFGHAGTSADVVHPRFCGVLRHLVRKQRRPTRVARSWRSVLGAVADGDRVVSRGAAAVRRGRDAGPAPRVASDPRWYWIPVSRDAARHRRSGSSEFAAYATARTIGNG